MNGKIYLIEYTVIVFIMMLFNRSSSLENMLISLLIVLIQIGFDKLNAIVHNERVKDVVKILETPYVEDHPPYRQEIAMLRSGVFDEQIMEKIKAGV